MRVLYILYILEMFEPDLEKIRSSNFACVDMEYGRIRSIDKNTPWIPTSQLTKEDLRSEAIRKLGALLENLMLTKMRI